MPQRIRSPYILLLKFMGIHRKSFHAALLFYNEWWIVCHTTAGSLPELCIEIMESRNGMHKRPTNSINLLEAIGSMEGERCALAIELGNSSEYEAAWQMNHTVHISNPNDMCFSNCMLSLMALLGNSMRKCLICVRIIQCWLAESFRLQNEEICGC